MEANCQQVLRMMLPELPDDMGTLLRYIRVPRYCAWLLLLLFLFAANFWSPCDDTARKSDSILPGLYILSSLRGDFAKTLFEKLPPVHLAISERNKMRKQTHFKYLHHKWLWRQLLDIKYFAYVGGLGLEMDFAFDGKHHKVTRWTSDADFHETMTKV